MPLHRRPSSLASTATPVAVNALWGPLTGFAPTTGTGTTSVSLNDADNSVAVIFCAPKAGTLDRIGVLVSTFTAGPLYNVGFVTLDGSLLPTTTPAFGSAVQTFQPTATGYAWQTLATPATVAAGDIVCVRIWPNATPDGTHFIGVRQGSNNFTVAGLPQTLAWLTAWTRTQVAAIGGLCGRYTDGQVCGGYPTTNSSLITTSFNSASASPEVGSVFTVPVAMTCIGARVLLDPTTAVSGETIRLYDSSNTVLGSRTVDQNLGIGIVDHLFDVFWTPVDLAVATNYRLAVEATDTDLRSLVVIPTPDTDSKNAVTNGSRWSLTSRPIAGSWTDVANTVPLMALWLSAVS